MSATRIMFGAAVAIAALAVLAGGATGANPAPAEKALKVGTTVDWSPDEDVDPLRFRAGDLSILVERVREKSGLAGPRLTLSAPGKTPAVLEGERAGITFPSRIAILPWDKSGAVAVLLESYSGGAHCCTVVQAAVPEGDGFRIVDLGRYDGEKLARLPSDWDGDGEVDFFVTDDAFLYAFSSYAGSLPPPMILNIIDGVAENVSDRPAFRPIFEQALARAETGCAEGENGHCAAYAAAAARLGAFDTAWEKVLKHHDAKRRDWPSACKVAEGEDGCPAGQEITYASYPEALRAFLVQHAYIAK
ncbi:MAG TPA: hypothetical protein VF680_06075 [Allosphingosinicella sp.]|jgi:hypothetical protein